MGENHPESSRDGIGAQGLHSPDIINVGDDRRSPLRNLVGDEDGTVERQVLDLAGMLARVGKHEPAENDIAVPLSCEGREGGTWIRSWRRAQYAAQLV